MFENVLDLESVCRLCLGAEDIMWRLYDVEGHTQAPPSHKILQLISMQMSPDDGLPSLMCNTCHHKIDQFIEFKQQIEASYNILCQCVAVSIANKETTPATDTDTNNYKTIQTVELTATDIITSEGFIQNKFKLKNRKNESGTNISSLFKDHLVSGIQENEILTNQDFNFVNVSYANVTDDAYMSISLQDDGNLLHKDISVVTQPENNDETVLSYIKPMINDTTKIYNVSFAEPNHDNLQDIFLDLENNQGTTESSHDGFEDISMYLKNSHGLDIKKLKEDYKNKEKLTLDQDNFKRKFLNSAISLIKSPDKNKCNAFTVEPNLNIDSVNVPADSLKSDQVHDEDHDVNDFPDMIFAKMSKIEKDKYIIDNCQDEILPRIVKITGLDSNDVSTQFKFNTFMCHLCLMEFRECGLSVLKNHCDSHFNDKSFTPMKQNKPTYSCEECMERFSTRYAFISHQRKKFDIRVFGCETCNKSFWSKDKLTVHNRTHKVDNNTTFPCMFCGEMFNKRQELQQHEQTHMRNAPLVCPHCNKQSTSVMSLKAHIKRHTEGLKYCCEICGKGFFLHSQLQRHEQIHSGIRKFPCYLCPKDFCSNAERRRHLRYHFKNKQFQCPECDKKFYENSHMKIHLRSHTNYRPFTCEVCNSSFYTKHKLRRHEMNHPKKSIAFFEQAPPKETTRKSKLNAVVEPKFTRLTDDVELVGIDAGVKSVEKDNDNVVVEIDGENYIIVQGEIGEDESRFDIDGKVVNMEDLQAYKGPDGQVFYVLEDDSATEGETEKV